MKTTPLKKKGSSRNRSAGHGYELTCKNLLIEIGFPHVVSTRSESRSRDADGIDLINKDEGKNGRLPYNIQCKNYCTHLKYHDILSRMPVDSSSINVIFHKLTSNKSKKGKLNKFITRGHYAILSKEDFIRIMKDRLELERLRKQLANDSTN